MLFQCSLFRNTKERVRGRHSVRWWRGGPTGAEPYRGQHLEQLPMLRCAARSSTGPPPLLSPPSSRLELRMQENNQGRVASLFLDSLTRGKPVAGCRSEFVFT